MRYFALLFCFVLSCSSLFAQVYTKGQTRHRFAQLVLGADLVSFPSSGQTYDVNALGLVVDAEAPAAMVPRINIAGTHFWGHASFYVSIPVGNLLDNALSEGGTFDFTPGVETGLRVYPWRIERGKVRPFVGTAFSVASWRQRSRFGTGSFAHHTRMPLQLGLTFQHQSLLLDVGYGAYRKSNIPYYVDRNSEVDITLPHRYLWIGLNFQLETTLSAERDYRNGVTAEQVRRAAEQKKLSAWSIAAGPSAAFVQGEAPRNDKMHPTIGDHRGTNIFFDFGLGYYYYPWDSHLNLAYRQNASSRSAYGRGQRLERRALTLEGFKFLGDYHGFVPFIGPHISREWLELTESEDGTETYRTDQQQWAGGITFGWDIRPNDLQGFILRTNLRYTPLRKIGEAGGVSFSQLEFNFIQLVLYPGRLKRIRKALQ